MRSLRQIIAVTEFNLRSLPQRVSSSLASVLGIAGVVAVLVAVLAMSAGISGTMAATGADDRVVVLRTGAATEMTSGLDLEAANAIMQAAAVKRDAHGQPIASAEALSLVLVTSKDGTDVSVPLRGVGRNLRELRPELTIVTGRMYDPAVNEVIVGARAQAQYKGLDLGRRIRTQGAEWTIVGVFRSNGDLHESEIIADSATLQSALRRPGVVQAVTLQLVSPAAFDELERALTGNPALSVEVRRERDYFAEQSRPLTLVLSVVVRLVGGIMAIGALVGALNTMYSSVSGRTVEIATLRALGFGATAIVVSVLVEAMLLALVGGLAGAGLAWVLFNGAQVATSAGGVVGASRVFDLQVNAGLVGLGLAWAGGIGLVGGLLPALRAARLPPAAALRTA
jgi:putative ABC transport system permease protein